MPKLTDILGGSLLGGIKEIIGQFKLSPEKKAELEATFEAHKHELAMKQAELEARLAEYQAREIEAAGANIRAEAQSGDKYTSRARPTFLYVVNVILVWNYIVVPLFKQQPLALPEPLFWLFGSVMLGYTGARTWEKVYGNGKNGKH